MKTETTSKPQQPLSHPMPQINKGDLAQKIRAYIIHSRFVILYSPNPNYRNMRTLSHLDLCQDLSKMLKSVEGVSMKDICQHTLMIRTNLEGILPAANNKSHESSCAKLQELLDDCRSYLNKIRSHEE